MKSIELVVVIEPLGTFRELRDSTFRWSSPYWSYSVFSSHVQNLLAANVLGNPKSASVDIILI